MKKSLYLFSVIVGLFLTTSAFAANAPKCPSLTSANTKFADSNGAVFLLPTEPWPWEEGIVMVKNPTTMADTISLAEDTYKNAKSSGLARLFEWDDGWGFYVCSSDFNNFNNINKKVALVETYSDDIQISPGVKAKGLPKKRSLEERKARVRSGR